MTSNQCANCGSNLQGAFCSSCGQSAKSRRGPIWQVASEFTEEFFSIDSKVLKSIAILLIKPGVLTARFINGKRASALPPVRLYLVFSLIFFFVFQIPVPDVKNENVYINGILLGRDVAVKGQPSYQLVQLSEGGNENFIGRWITNFFQDKKSVLKATNPEVTVERVFNRLENIIPNILILFLPFFALLMKLLYLFKKRLYFDHLIFSLHFQTWLMGIILIIYALALQNPWWSLLSMIIPVYLAKAQKVVYKQTYWLVIPKTFLILTTYLLLLGLGSVVAFLTSISQL